MSIDFKGDKLLEAADIMKRCHDQFRIITEEVGDLEEIKELNEQNEKDV